MNFRKVELYVLWNRDLKRQAHFKMAYKCSDGAFPHHWCLFGETGVIGSDVPWLECPACNALTWVITVTE